MNKLNVYPNYCRKTVWSQTSCEKDTLFDHKPHSSIDFVACVAFQHKKLFIKILVNITVLAERLHNHMFYMFTCSCETDVSFWQASKPHDLVAKLLTRIRTACKILITFIKIIVEKLPYHKCLVNGPFIRPATML